MSTRPVSTGTPTASIASTSDLTSDSTMSTSWIIRSKTTSMSRLRSGNVPRRWTSMNRGSVSSGRAAATAGLKRSVWPTASDAAGPRRRVNHVVGFGEAARHRLFDQHVHARRRETAARSRGAARSARRASRRRPCRARRGSRSARSSPLAAAISCRPRLVDVDDRHQLHARAAWPESARDAGRDDRRRRRRCARS